MTDHPATAPEEPGRGRRLPRHERRRQLLDCARAVFAAERYAGASMEQIAERAEVSKPVLYQHFPSKHELFLELLDAEVASLRALLEAAMDTRRDNRERVRATVAAVFEYMASPERTHRLIFDSGIDGDPEVRTRSEAVHRLLSSEVARTIRADTTVAEAEAEVRKSWERARGTEHENEFTPPPGGDAKDTIGGLHDDQDFEAIEE